MNFLRMRDSPMLLILVACCIASVSGMALTNAAAKGGGPVVLGHGVGLFEVGSVIAEDDFENLDSWIVQIQEKDGAPPAKVAVKEGTLDCFLPNRGATIWFNRELPTRVAITYDVVCPSTDASINGFMPRDINNFWMASDPENAEEGLFDFARYTGSFDSYNKMHGYYASTGGGQNTTTRMRRYPREIDAKPVPHVALKDRDGIPGFLITPNKVMKIQLVAFDDVIQYIVDGKLVYQMKRGDSISVEGRDEDGQTTSNPAVNDTVRFPVYNGGYFGFRMVGTHHIYTNFKVYALESTKER